MECASAQVWPGDDLSASATVTAIETVDGTPIAEFSVETKNQDRVVVLSGSAAAVLIQFLVRARPPTGPSQALPKPPRPSLASAP